MCGRPQSDLRCIKDVPGALSNITHHKMSATTDLSLNNRVALVTGGGKGMGLMISKSLAKHGAKVYISGRCYESLADAASGVTGYAGFLVPIVMAVPDEVSVRYAAHQIQEFDGKLDILVNNAGLSTIGNSNEFGEKKLATLIEGRDLVDPETFQGWEDMLRLNLIAPFFVIKAFIPLLTQGAKSRMEGTSAVINITSVSATSRTVVDFSSFAYGPSKAGLNHLTSQLATHFARNGVRIRCNAVQPGAFLSSAVEPEVLEEYKTNPFPGYTAPIPLMRLGREEDIERTVVYLAASDYTNGVILTVDGGLSLVNP